MHVTHLDGHCFGSDVRVLPGPEPPPHGCAAPKGGAACHITTRCALGSAAPQRGVTKPRSLRLARLAADLSLSTRFRSPG
jgi:hypothetical protein